VSELAEDMLNKAVKRVGKLRKSDWGLRTREGRLAGEGWVSISEEMVKIMDEMREHGASKPLAALQELAFVRALEEKENAALQTVALWLTDSRLYAEEYARTNDPSIRKALEKRKLMARAQP
jgi:hypothetical protein